MVVFAALFFSTYIAAVLFISVVLEKGTLFERVPVAFFIHASLICFPVGLLSAANIATDLVFACAVNVVICMLCYAAMRVTSKGHVFQKSILDSGDALAYIIAAAICITVFCVQFNNEMLPHFNSVDAASHTLLAREIAESGVVWHMYYTHYFDSLWMRACAAVFGSVEYYKVFSVCQYVFLFFGGLVFYSVAKTEKKLATIAISIVLMVVFMIGYPLNAVFHGFNYLNAGVFIVGSIVWLIINRKSIPSKAAGYCSLAALLLGLCTSYCLFCPPVYLAILALIVYDARRCGRKSTRTIVLSICIIVPSVIIGYLIVYRTIFESITVSSQIAAEGGVYKDLYSGFVFIAPAAIYGLFNAFKYKKTRSIALLFIAIVLFALLLFVVGVFFNRVSSYYFFKCHFLIWFFALLYAVYGLASLLQSNRAAFAAYCSVWAIVFALALSGIDDKLAEKRPLYDPTPASRNFFPIIQDNVSFLKTEETIPKQEIELYDAYKSIVGESNDGLPIVIGRHVDAMWFDAIEGATARDNFYSLLTDEQIEENIENAHAILIITTDNARAYHLKSKDGTPIASLIGKYSTYGPVLFENEIGMVVYIG